LLRHPFAAVREGIRFACRGKSATLRPGKSLKTLHKYITGQVLAALLLTVAVFAFVVLLLNALKDVLPLLFSGQASLWLVLKAVGLLLPFACVYALPMGFITATLLVFGRFSADQELTAARAGGISLLALISPVLLLSLLCCALSAWFNMELGPRSRVAFLELRRGLVAEMVNAQLPEGRFIRDFPGYIFYVGKNDGGLLKNVMIYKVEDETNVVATVRAPQGRLNPDRASNQLILNLTDPRIFKVDAQGRPAVMSFSTLDVNLSPTIATNKSSKPQIGDMTFSQLRQELRTLEKLNLKTGVGTNSTEQLKSQLAAIKKQRKDLIEPVRVAMHREVAFSFACFGFTLVGIPLGIRVHRRETNIGIGIALGLVLVYYAFIMLGMSLAGKPEFFPHLILWVPNFIFQAVGAVLLWRANRGI
jgi:lipopolysaccharide export system permease protein